MTDERIRQNGVSGQTQVSDQTGLSGQALLLYLKAVGGWWVSEFGL